MLAEFSHAYRVQRINQQAVPVHTGLDAKGHLRLGPWSLELGWPEYGAPSRLSLPLASDAIQLFEMGVRMSRVLACEDFSAYEDSSLRL